MDLILEQRQEGGNPLMSKAAFAHPSQLKVPSDFEELIKMHKVDTSSVPPLLFLTCENDPQFPIESQQKADESLEQLNEGRVDGKILYKRVYYAGNDHGFAVRGDVSKEHVKLAKEDAFKQAVQWFRR